MNEDLLSRLCIHTITTKPWSLAEALEHYAQAGIGGVSVWRDAALAAGISQAARLLRESPLSVVSYVRGGFFPHRGMIKRRQALDDNRRMIDEAAAIGAPLLVLVCGAEPRQPLEESRRQIHAGIEAIIPHAEQCGVKLAIEPLHPMYADTRSAINTLAQATDMAEAIGHALVGVAADVYHLWWDPRLEDELRRCGALGRLFAYHLCDWRVPTEDFLLDRGLMGEGCIPLRRIGEWVRQAGFQGFHEVEIFSTRW
jgi:sugar phosphate isomerase/epimerase